MSIDTVGIFGAGAMGRGIAQVCAQTGLTVGLVDVSEEILEQARQAIAWSTEKLHQKGVIADSAETILRRVHSTTRPDTIGPCDLLIEAVFEDLATKKAVLETITQQAAPLTLIASNTSALSITDLATTSGRPDRFLGIHFFNPVPMMKAVEVIRGAATSDATFGAGVDFVRQLGKHPIAVQRDVPGFLLNRINLPSTIEAMRLVEQGVGTVEDIDQGVKLALGRKMGIFETGDLVGLDVTYGALRALFEQTRDPRWTPPTILQQKVARGELGRKTGRGWYTYDDPPPSDG